MKKLFYLLLLFCVSLSFAACGGDDEEEKKEEEKPFEWKGDWNDTTDPEYPKFDVEKYPDGYNPIVGEWVDVDGEAVRLLFTTDFQIILSAKVNGNPSWETKVWAEKYMINDIGIKYERLMNSNTIEEYKIIKEDGVDVLMLRYQPNPTKWSKWKRYYK